MAFGTDIEGAGPGAILSNYVDLREVADTRIHGTTGLQPGQQLRQERASLQPLPASYAGLTVPVSPALPAERPSLRERFSHWPQAVQHPLSVYDRLLGVAA